MGKVCAKCGAENREKAKFCKGCGGKLAAGSSPEPVEGASSSRPAPPAPPPPDPLLTDAARVDVHPAFEHVTERNGLGSRKLMLISMLLVTSALMAWFYLHQQRTPSLSSSLVPPTLATASAPPSANPPVAVVLEVNEPTVSAPATENTSSAAPPVVDPAAEAAEAERVNALNAHNARLNQRRLERERREKRERMLAAQEQARAARELEQQRAEQARREARSTPVQTVVAVPTPAKPVAPAPTVARICAEAGNFFTREVCRARECLKTSQANDPICVDFRKLEEARRAREQFN